MKVTQNKKITSSNVSLVLDENTENQTNTQEYFFPSQFGFKAMNVLNSNRGFAKKKLQKCE